MRRLQSVVGTALGQFADGAYNRGRRKPVPNDPCSAVCNVNSATYSDVRCAVCRAGDAPLSPVWTTTPSYAPAGCKTDCVPTSRGCACYDYQGNIVACPCPGVPGNVVSPTYTFGGRSFGIGGSGLGQTSNCATPCQKLPNGQCACYDRNGALMSCSSCTTGFSLQQQLAYLSQYVG